MIQSTKDYSKFKLRDDNREKGVDMNHVQRLIKSIQAKNLLHLRPIQVNEAYEVIDGQNRLEAAKKLGCNIYYEVSSELVDMDIIRLNVVKPWKTEDYLNFFCKQGNQNYIKLRDFLTSNNLSVTTVVRLIKKDNSRSFEIFKSGQYVYDDKVLNVDVIETCKQTIDIIKSMGTNSWTRSSKFWVAMILLFNHPDFDAEIWLNNARMMSNRFHNCVSIGDHLQMLVNINNWRNRNKIREFDKEGFHVNDV